MSAEADDGYERVAPRESARRIFICYPRKLLDETAEFEATLRDCLQTLDPNYTVFRDIAEVEGDSIAVGKDWKDVINKEIDACDCCVVVLVPAIFDRPECVYEIERFHRRIDNGEKCFFFPIAFLPVADEFGRRLSQGHPVARILNHLHRYDFTKLWSETQRKVYKSNVVPIAQRIHKSIRDLKNEEVLQKGPTRQEKDTERRSRSFQPVAVIVGFIVIALTAAWLLWPPTSQIVAWTPLPAGTQFENWSKFRVSTFTAPSRDSPSSVPIESGQAVPASKSDLVERGLVKGEAWLSFPLGSSGGRYFVPASDLHHVPAK